MAEDKSDKKKEAVSVKMPSAKKRDIQSEQRRKRNQSYRSSVATAVRSLEASLAKKEAAETLKTKLSTIYTLMDKGLKKGVYKANKAARTKSRLTARVNAV
jgi:small subunit ribosomal protein S20